MSTNAAHVAKYLILDVFGSVVRFPFWWYAKGLRLVAVKALLALQYRIQKYGLSVWIKNFFVPMYGQRDISGRLISVLMRFFVLIARAVAIAAEGAVYALGLLAYLLLPIGSAIMFVLNLTAYLF